MSDPEENKLKAEIDKIMIRTNKIIKKIEANKPEDDNSKQNNE
ncbi:MAG: hypothetical protein WB792_17000 [Desulfobacterales bacterium]